MITVRPAWWKHGKPIGEVVALRENHKTGEFTVTVKRDAPTPKRDASIASFLGRFFDAETCLLLFIVIMVSIWPCWQLSVVCLAAVAAQIPRLIRDWKTVFRPGPSKGDQPQ